jgi:SAM-dependent methyltransferase
MVFVIYKDLAHIETLSYRDNIITFCGETISKTEFRYTSSGNDVVCRACLEKYHKHMVISLNIAINAFDAVIDSQREYDISSPNLKTYYGASMFRFIPLPTYELINSLIALKEIITDDKRWSGYNKNGYKKFLDAGCGCGNVLLLAYGSNIADKYVGIEYDEENIKKAKILLKKDYREFESTCFDIIKHDILFFDKYNEYDIIYYYCPFSDDKTQASFEMVVEDQMKVGAILIPYMKKNSMIINDKRFEKIKTSSKSTIYIKVSDDKKI